MGTAAVVISARARVLAGTILVLWTGVQPVCAADIGERPSATRAFVEAVQTMERLPQPARVRFTTHVQATGVNIALVEGHGRSAGYAGFELGWGGGMRPETSWIGFHRHEGDRTVLVKDGKPLYVTSPMYDPSWDGAHDWFRYGFSGTVRSARAAAPSPSPSPMPVPAAEPGALRVIGSVRALNAGDYVVEDAPAATCPDGRAGRPLRLVARTDPEHHPLTEVIVDAENRFCTMRFNIGQTSMVSLTGDFELHFGSVGDYWLTTDGSARFLFRAFGVGAKRATVKFTYGDFGFPSSDAEIPAPAVPS
jgi:hypothetical protein